MLLLSLLACDASWGPAPGFTGGGDPDLGLPPTLTLDLPEDGAELIYSEDLSLVGTVTDPDTSLDQLRFVVTSDAADELEATFEVAGGGNFGAIVNLPVGAHTLTVAVFDEFDQSASAEVSVTKLENRTPSDPVIAISPQDPVAGEEIAVFFAEESVDPDGDEVFYAYNWFKDGVAQEQYAGAPGIPDEVTGRNQIWRVEVNATDGVNQSAIATDEVEITSDGPIINVSIEPFNASANDDLVCAYSVNDPEGNPITEQEATWLVNGTEAGDADSPLTSGFVRDDQVTCRVRAVSTVEKSRQETIVVKNAAPTITSITMSPTEVREADTVTCTIDASDADGDPVNATATWYVDGVATVVGSTIDGTNFDKGEELSCGVRADDAKGGVSNEVSTQTILVKNTVPSTAVLSMDPFPAFPGDTVECVQDTAPTDPDPADTLTVDIAWAVNGTTDGTATTSTYDSTGLTDGDKLKCTVTASDGNTNSVATASVTLTERLSGTLYGFDADATIKGTKANAYFGHTVLNPGDVDGDGDDDLLISAYGHTSSTGAVFLFSGASLTSGNQRDSDADYWWTGSATGNQLGGAPQGIGMVGDTDGDGYADLLMAEPYANGEAGAVYLFESGDIANWGAGNDADGEATAIIEGVDAKDRMGSGLGGTDIDGDGLSDLILAIPYDDGQASNAGAVVVFLGGVSGTVDADDADYTMTGDGTADRLGLNAVRTVGDVDGDGTDDLVIGAQNMDATSTQNTGVAFVVGSGDIDDDQVSNLAALRIEGINSNDSFGDSATGLGDLDADGYDEFAVGARFGDVDATDGGSVYFWFGSTTTGTVSANTADASWGSNSNGDRLGWELSTGDLDGDGAQELMTGAYSRTFNSKSGAGASYVLLGSDYTSWTTGANIDDDEQVRVVGNLNNHYVGRSAVVLGDINGDGYDEYVVGGEGKNNGSSNRAGFVYLFYGP
jgi:hypothetical protein